MIEIAGQDYALNDPRVIAALAGIAGLLLLLLLLLLAVRRAGQAVRAMGPLAHGVTTLGQRVEALGQGQERLAGGVTAVSEAQATSQAQVLQTMEMRMADVQRQMADTLHANTLRATRSIAELNERLDKSLGEARERTVKSLTELQERLQVIDRAQDNITKLSGDVLSLQDILSNKQTRGAFGEIQLTDIVSKALPSDSYAMQATLSNGRRADCLIHLPNPPGPIVIDSKFPLEAYEALRRAKTQGELDQAARALRQAVRTHIKAISERYILDGETADGAVMFLPSEAVYAELHANFPEIVREGFAARVWIVSPTTCMATLHTMRAILKDARMREQAGAIRKMLAQLHRDVELVLERAAKLETHFDQARRDVEGLTTAAERAGKRAARLDSFDFEELGADNAPVSLGHKPAP